MHDIKSIRDNPAAFDAALKRRGLEPLSASLLAIDEKRRAAILASEQAQARRNSASKEIGDAKKAKDDARASKLMAEVAELKTTMPQLEAAAKAADDELARELAAIPNLPLDEVPDGVDEHGNVQHHLFGAVRNYAFTPRPHDDLGGALGYMDFEAAAKLSGARFVVLKKGLARLERAIGQFMLDLHTNEHGYAEINPPLLVRNDTMFGTGQLPKFEDDQFWAVKGELLATVTENATAALRSERLGLIPTAEVPLYKSRSRIHPRREGTPDTPDRADAVLSRGGGGCGARHPRHDPPASVHKGRTGLDHDAGGEPRRARAHAGLRRGSAAAARSALPRDDPLRRRHGIFRAEDL